MKNPKWLAEIELIPNEYNGYWEVRGWDKEAIVKTTSVTDIKGKLEVVNSLA
jgi:DMSO/TMAO reductase YedYZ molybdopterin-dependent catalytic subunit